MLFLRILFLFLFLGISDANDSDIYIATYVKGFINVPEKFDDTSLNYRLTFNEVSSKFEILNKEDLKLKEATTFNGSSIYFNNSKDSIIYDLPNNSVFSDKYLIELDYKILDWQITSETKTIKGYTCFKAYRYQIGLDFKKALKEPLLVAWFAPKLNFKHGPADAAGLPGLVLEYTYKNFFYKIEKLEAIPRGNDDFVNGLKPKGDFKKIAYFDYMKKVIKWYRGIEKKYRK